MNILREFSGLGSRPYPFDSERKWRVMAALAEHKMILSDLAKNIGISKAIVSKVINGRRLSRKTEERIAAYLGKSADYLFPRRTPEEIGAMRRAEEETRGKAA